MQTIETYCRICEAACGLLADLDDHGKLVKLRPNRSHPVSHGFVCAKGTRFGEVASHPSRIVQPQRRRPSSGPTPTSWTEATRSIAAQLRSTIERHGPHSVALYLGNPTIYNAGAALAAALFAKRIGTRNVYSSGSQDCNNKFAGAELIHGSPLIHPLPDFEHTQLALLFGTNPAVSQSSFVHLEGGTRAFDRLVERGGEIVWIDPRLTESARRWGRHMPIRPGSDVWLILALLHILGDERERLPSDSNVQGLEQLLEVARTVSVARAAELTGIPEGELHSLAAAIRRSRATTFHMSVGVNHGPFGTLSYVALQALAYVTGNFDRRGGVLFAPLALGAARVFRLLGMGSRQRRSRVGGFPSVLDTLPGAILADEILQPGDGQVRALIVVAGDPLRSIPGEARLRQAFGALELLVSIDLFENETGRLADWLLPATSWLERPDIAVMTGILQQASLLPTTAAVVLPPGEAQHEAKILLDLLAAVDGGVASRLMARSCELPWQRWFLRFGHGIQVATPEPGQFLTGRRVVRFFGRELATEAERLRVSAELDDRPDGFTLIGRRRRLGHNSWLHGAARDGEAEDVAWMVASDLTALGIPSGGRVRIESVAGGIEIAVAAKDGIAPRTIVVPHGLPASNVNALIPSGPSAGEPLSGQHRITGISVTVKRVDQR